MNDTYVDLKTDQACAIPISRKCRVKFNEHIDRYNWIRKLHSEISICVDYEAHHETTILLLKIAFEMYVRIQRPVTAVRKQPCSKLRREETHAAAMSPHTLIFAKLWYHDFEFNSYFVNRGTSS